MRTRAPRGEFDWATVRARIEKTLAPELERDERQVLLERAKRYARAELDTEREVRREYLCFGLDGQIYAIETRYVIEVSSRELTRVPGAPARLLGLSNLRGEILPVFDLARALGRDAKSSGTEGKHLIVLGVTQPELALVATSLEGVVPLPDREILAQTPHVRGRPGIAGITREALVVLDGQALLEGPIFRLDEADETARTAEVNP